MALKYAELERRLGEIDRARAIYVHTSQYCDPRSDTIFWPLWHNFEVSFTTPYIPCYITVN
jgi:pre-mRNA-splicing factor SYF1